MDEGQSEGPSLFKLRDGVTFLNHGSFGKCPREVLAKQAELRDQLEEEPVDFLARSIYTVMPEAMAALASFVHAPPHSVVFARNVTAALNAVVRCVVPSLGPEDEILATDMEYGACDRLFTYVLEQSGRSSSLYRHVAFAGLRDDPSCTPQSLADEFCSHFTERTKVVFVSHITSVTALTLPVALICQRARERGIVSIVDGAHALGQVELDMEAIGADYYAGNCHKWLMAPKGEYFDCFFVFLSSDLDSEWQSALHVSNWATKGCGFLYCAPQRQHLIAPLVISWGWRREDEQLGVGVKTFGSDFVDGFCWPGTDDPTPALCVPCCIDFQRRHDYAGRVRARCHELCRYARQQVAALTGLPQLYPDSPDFYSQMVLMPVPGNARELHAALWEKHKVEIPGIVWQGRHFIRISCQYYNTRADVDRLVACLKQVWNMS